MKSPAALRAGLARRLLATRRVWQRGGAHMAMLAQAVDPVPEPEPARRPLPAAGFDLELHTSPVPRGVISVDGWAVSERGPCSRVELTVNGHPAGRARLGELRPDVEGHVGLRFAALGGFHHFVNLAELPSLGEEVELGGVAVGLDGARFALPAIQFRVEPADSRTQVRQPRMVHRPRVRRQRLQEAGEPRELKLLVYTHELGYGGAQLFLAELLRRIAELGPVGGLVVSPADGPTRHVLEEIGFEVHVTSPLPVGSLEAYEARLEELLGWAGGEGFHAAFVNTMVAFAGADLAVGLGLPTLWAIHESWPLPEYWAIFEGVVDPGVRQRAEAALGLSTAAFTCRATRACYEPYFPGLPCLTLPYGIDVDGLDAWRVGFDRAGARRMAGIGDDQTVVLCVGTIEPRKAQTQLVHAFAQIADRHPGALLQLVGSRGDQHAQAAYEAALLYGLEDRVQIQPVLADVRPSYAMADLLVSASDVESTPRSILEAMALGLPVLSTNVFGVPEVITNGEDGWLCEPRDVMALAQALDHVLSLGAAERQAVAERARATVEAEYRSEVCSRAWDQALRELARFGAIPPRPAAQPLRTNPGRAEARRS